MLSTFKENIELFTPTGEQIEFIRDLIKGNVPTTLPPVEGNQFGHFALTDVLKKDLFMYSYVYKDYCESLAKWIGDRKALEVMAGVGWLTKGLREAGVDVVGTDGGTWKTPIPSVCMIITVDAIKAVKKIDSDVLIMSWPWMDNTAYEVIKAWGTERPIIYIGEWSGCTANDKFFAHFDTNKYGHKLYDEYKGFGHYRLRGAYDDVHIGHFSGDALREYETDDNW